MHQAQRRRAVGDNQVLAIGVEEAKHLHKRNDIVKWVLRVLLFVFEVKFFFLIVFYKLTIIINT